MQIRPFKAIALTLALTLPLVGVVACGPKQDPNVANVKAGAMPDGATWRGVYYSQIYGNLHLIEEGGNIEGRWRTAAGDSWGELHGKADGDILRYEWVEHKIGLVGPAATRSGKGYFRYMGKVKSEGPKEPDELKGEWGLGEKEVGNEWTAIKQINVDPNPDSVRPDEVESNSAVSSSGWDEGGEKQEEGSEEGSGSSE